MFLSLADFIIIFVNNINFVNDNKELIKNCFEKALIIKKSYETNICEFCVNTDKYLCKYCVCVNCKLKFCCINQKFCGYKKIEYNREILKRWIKMKEKESYIEKLINTQIAINNWIKYLVFVKEIMNY